MHYFLFPCSGSALVYVGAHSGKFACVDVELGEELWTQQLPDRIEATASISESGSFIYVGRKHVFFLNNHVD
jgi:outer membrane protein assembly factor BamB